LSVDGELETEVSNVVWLSNNSLWVFYVIVTEAVESSQYFFKEKVTFRIGLFDFVKKDREG
jgi:hypothetical protein